MLRLACLPNALCIPSGPIRVSLLLVAAVLFAGCATDGPMPTTDKFLVSAKAAQFYKYGPAQAFGPDFNLPQGQKVTMLQRQFGFSRIMLEDGTSGYVATEELKPAPPEPPPPRQVAARTAKPRSSGGWFSSGKPKRSNVESIPTDPLFDINDVPLPMPDDSPSEGEKPKPPGFRY